MGPSNSGNTTFDNAVDAALGVAESAIEAASTQATANAAAVTFYRAVVASAVANNIDAAPFIGAIQNLGKTV